MLLLVSVMAGTELLGLNMCPLLRLTWFTTQGGECVLLRRWGWWLWLSLGGWLLRRRWWLLLLLGHPDMPSACWGSCGATDPVAACVGDLARLAMGDWNSWVAIGWEILVKLINIKSLYVRDDITAEFPNVHVSEVNMGWLSSSFLQWATFPLQVLLTRLDICFRSGGRSRWPLRLPCKEYKGDSSCYKGNRFSLMPLKSHGKQATPGALSFLITGTAREP